MTITRGSLVPDGPPADYVRRLAAQGFAVTVNELTGRSRERPLVSYRQATMCAIRILCGLSYPSIARMFDNRDHTTVLHACQLITGGKHERAGHRRRLWDMTDRLCHEVRRQWAIDTGRPFPDPGQMSLSEPDPRERPAPGADLLVFG